MKPDQVSKPQLLSPSVDAHRQQYWTFAGMKVISLDAFLPCMFTDVQLFTGLDCSGFRQIYCTSLLLDVSSFPAEKSKTRRANWRLSSVGKGLQQGLLTWHCVAAAVP